MKKLSVLFVFLFAFSAYAQTDSDRAAWVASILDEAKLSRPQDRNQVLKYNFAPLWTRVHDNDSVLGYIGDDYQRLRLVILSATKVAGKPDTYNVTGKSMVKNVVRAFSGTMKITDARLSKNMPDGVDEEYKGKVKENGVVVGEYHFSEGSRQTNTGMFDGVFATYWYVDRRGRLQYDEIEVGADGWTNNQFAGTWTSYRTKTTKPASWGDSRIPVSGDLDIGAGEFSPDEKYIGNGWQGYRDAYTKQNKRALAEERRQWWR